MTTIQAIKALGYGVAKNQEFGGYEISEDGVVVQFCSSHKDLENFLRQERHKIFNPPKPWTPAF